jgi:4-hydroxy-3-methylbut-2-enyl diphosphate reductase
MEVILAEPLGMCFGVRDALAATREIANPDRVTILGELVHNRVVGDELSRRGFHHQDESEREVLPTTAAALVTAHGVSNRYRARLDEAGKQIVDTTCPLVRRAHEAAQSLAREGYHVIILGRRQHVEVRGLAGDLDGFDIVEDEDDVTTYPFDRLGVIAQTTTPVDTAQHLCNVVRERNPQATVRWVDTICQPTKDRQTALASVLPRVDAMVVVGGHNSNNTRKLAARCASFGVPAYHIEDAIELKDDWFRDAQRVGLTAGTSTLDETIQRVYGRLVVMGPPRARVPARAGREDRA